MQLVTFDVAKAHLNIDPSNTLHDVVINFKLHQASEIVLNYLHHTSVPDEWIEDDSPLVYAAPYNVQAAVLLALGELFDNRESSTANIVSDGFKNILEGLWDPTLQ